MLEVEPTVMVAIAGTLQKHSPGGCTIDMSTSNCRQRGRIVSLRDTLFWCVYFFAVYSRVVSFVGACLVLIFSLLARHIFVECMGTLILNSDN